MRNIMFLIVALWALPVRAQSTITTPVPDISWQVGVGAGHRSMNDASDVCAVNVGIGWPLDLGSAILVDGRVEIGHANQVPGVLVSNWYGGLGIETTPRARDERFYARASAGVSRLAYRLEDEQGHDDRTIKSHTGIGAALVGGLILFSSEENGVRTGAVTLEVMALPAYYNGSRNITLAVGLGGLVF